MLNLLNESKKSSSFYTKETMPNANENFCSTVMNMLAVNQGTGMAGMLSIWVVETARNAGLDVSLARNIADYFQRLSLDSKHVSDVKNGVKGYKANDWYQLAEYINTVNKNKTSDEISEDIDNIIQGIFTPAENKSDDKKLFIPKAMRSKLGL